MAESLIDTITLDDLIHDEAEASFPLIPSGACHTYHNVFANGKANAEHNSNLACSSVAATAAVTATATTATAQQLGTAAWNPTQVSDDAANAARAFSSAA